MNRSLAYQTQHFEFSEGAWPDTSVTLALSALPTHCATKQFITTISNSVKALLDWADLGTSIRKAPIFAMDLLAELFVFRNTGEISAFTDKHPYLLALANEAGIALRCHFPVAKLELALETDPEYGNKQLVIIIVCSQTPTEAMARMDAYDDDCGLNIIRKSDGLLITSMEFK